MGGALTPGSRAVKKKSTKRGLVDKRKSSVNRQRNQQERISSLHDSISQGRSSLCKLVIFDQFGDNTFIS